MKRTTLVRRTPLQRSAFVRKPPTRSEVEAALARATRWDPARNRHQRQLRTWCLARDDYRCQAVAVDPDQPCGFGLTAHHVIPRGRGGSDDLSNLLTVCGLHHDVIHHVRPALARELGLLRSGTA